LSFGSALLRSLPDSRSWAIVWWGLSAFTGSGPIWTGGSFELPDVSSGGLELSRFPGPLTPAILTAGLSSGAFKICPQTQFENDLFFKQSQQLFSPFFQLFFKIGNIHNTFTHLRDEKNIPEKGLQVVSIAGLLKIRPYGTVFISD
jgi:hypothetical protein